MWEGERATLVAMAGDTSTLSWRLPSPGGDGIDRSPEFSFTGDGGPVKILKVCFSSNSNLGRNFKLVKCDSSWQIRVRTKSSFVKCLKPNIP